MGVDRLVGSTFCKNYLIILKTLGNGYLGSRIDEERSKMRYLV
jgi:trehalose/maltose hydrolase-like predicted phosphorylase